MGVEAGEEWGGFYLYLSHRVSLGIELKHVQEIMHSCSVVSRFSALFCSVCLKYFIIKDF